MAYELARDGSKVECEVILPIKYEDINIDAGYRIDMIVGDSVIIENKTVVKEFALKLGVSPAYIYDLEAGKKTKISNSLAFLISAQFGVDVDWLLTGEEKSDRVMESRPVYGLDDLSENILEMLKGMTKDQKRETLRFIKGQKFVDENEKKLKEG